MFAEESSVELIVAPVTGSRTKLDRKVGHKAWYTAIQNMATERVARGASKRCDGAMRCG